MLTMDANSADPVQKQQNTASDQGLHCLLTGISVQNKNENSHQKPLKLEMDLSK